MRLLIVTTSYPRNKDDMSGIFIKRLAIAMSRAGAKITVLAPGDKNAQSEEIDNGIHIVRFAYAPRSLMKLAYGEGGIPENLKHYPWLKIILPFFIISLTLNGIRLARHCDLIHANWLFTGLFLLPAQKLIKKPMVVTLRGSDLKNKSSKLLALIVKMTNSVTTVNQQWANDLKKIFDRKIFYTPNGVEVIEKSLCVRKNSDMNSNEINVICVGILCFRKGTDILAQVAKIMININPNIRFTLAGQGNPKEFNLESLPNVTYIGPIPPNKIFSFYASGDIFILPSRHEGRPNVLLEAMASGLPSVATKLPGVLEVLTDECGILVDVEDSEAMATAICTLANNPEERRKMGEKAKARIRELSLDWGTSAAIYLNIFKEVISCAE